MSADLKDDILNAVRESEFIKRNSKTPKFRKPTPAQKPNPNYIPSPSVVKTNPPNVGSSVQSPKKHCTYETPCGWCTKWDKKCDRKIPKPNPCGQCRYNNWFLPQCDECDESNDFKNFRIKENNK